MDPTANLKRTRVLAASVLSGAYELDDTPAERALDELAALAQSLDEWLSRGGFLPRAWHDARMAPPVGAVLNRSAQRAPLDGAE